MTALWGKADPIPRGRNLAISIGKFDGVHRGHRRLLNALRDRASEKELESLAIALDPHPLAVLAPDSAPLAINPVADRAALLKQLGLDHVKLLEFDRELASLTADEFLASLAAAGMRLLVAGANTRIGRRRAAGIAEIREVCARLDVAVLVVPIASDGQAFSTANLRARLTAGDLPAARIICNRPHSFAGLVEPGDGRGKELGFATANLVPDPGLHLPPDGVYAVSVLLENEGALRPGVANLGVRPTFGGARRLLEAHLFDYSGCLHGARVRVYFEDFLRPEIRFANARELSKQIESDCRAAHAVAPGGPCQYAPWLPISP